jgi:hypothetical protein
MPRLSCWFIRAALLHLTLGAVFGGLILSAKGMPVVLGWAWRLLPAHIQLMVGGWLLQLTLGMGYWILPRLNGTGERGRAGWAWASFIALNGGVAGAAGVFVLRGVVSSPLMDALLVLAAASQVLALGAFVTHAWPRVQPSFASQQRGSVE